MIRTLLLFGLCSHVIAQSSPVDWRFAHPDADVKMTVDVQALLKCDAVTKAIEQFKAQAKDNAAQIELGLAIARSIDRIAVSARQPDSNNTDALVLVSGSFDPALITGFFPKTGKSKVKAIGPHSILIGEGDSFDGAVERISGAPAAVEADPDPSDIWVEVSGDLIAKQSAQSGGLALPALKDLRNLAIGLKLNDPPEFNIELTTANEGASGELANTIQQAILAAPLAFPQLGSAGKALSVKQDGSNVRVHFVVPPELLALAQQQASSANLPPQLAPFLSAFGVGDKAAAQPNAAQPSSAQSNQAQPKATQPSAQPNNDGKVRIFGLDGGPKEIPASK